VFCVQMNRHLHPSLAFAKVVFENGAQWLSGIAATAIHMMKNGPQAAILRVRSENVSQRLGRAGTRRGL
jgi:hypothetical protein